jgi:hypothetical protein
MKRWLLISLILSLLFFASSVAFTQDSSKGKALSLKVLQERLRAHQKKGDCSEDLLRLAGIRRIVGYIVDEANRDLILIGEEDVSIPPLYLEDFVVGLRNAWRRYTTKQGHTMFYSDPGCSIDPDKNVMQRLDFLGQQILRCTSPEEVEKSIKDWHRICQSPQSVRVLGIPFDTRFAWVTVKADYDMKRIVDGYDSLNIPGLNSLTDITLDKARSDIIQRRDISIPFSSMNRFWFYPGENSYKEDKGVVIIERSQVVLLTEEEYQNKRGEIIGKGHPEALAQKFTERFTEKYTEVAKQRPIFAELENLFRFVALAKIMNFKSPHNEAKLDLGYLLENFQVQRTSVNHQLPGRSHVKRFQHRRDFPGRYEINQLWLPTCGGVGINISVSQSNFVKDTTGRLTVLKATVLKARPSPEALSWDFPLMWKVRFEQGDTPFTLLAKR